MQSIKHFLERRLKLTVNEKKSHVDRVDGCSFLGFTFIRGKIRWTEKAYAKFKDELKRLTGRSWFVTMDYRMKKLGQYIRGWINCSGISECEWPRCRTRVRNLIRLGCPLDDAISVGMSRKGPWHLSKTFATQRAMSNKWPARQGLVSIRDEWVKIHYPATARLSS